jgi:serine/threonine-protein kinase PknK
MSPRAPGAPEQVDGYTGLERVGQGGFSVVYRAHQEHLQRSVALKVLLHDVADDRELRRFRRECQLTGRLTGHPNIVTVLDTGTTRSGRPYVAMEYFAGGSLGDRVARMGPLPLDEVLRVGVKIAGALAAAHGAGILHRDVKPQNVLVSGYGEPALADFGIATLAGSVDVSAGSEALTPYHAAPEILEGRAPSAASDIYSLGSTLYQLLAGRPAHQRDEGGAIAPLLLRILNEPPPDITGSDVPPQVMDVLRQAMARSPEERFPDALAFAERLRDLQRELGLPVTELVARRREDWKPPAAEPAVQPSGVTDLRTIGGPRLDGTITMPGLELRHGTEPEPPPGRRRPWRLVAAAAAVGCAAAVAILLVVPRAGSAPAPRPGPASAPPTPTAAVVPPAVLEAARPAGVTVVDRGTSAALRWQLGAANRYPLFVQRLAPGQPPAPPTPLPAGTTTTTVSGLDAHAGYCFQVGALVALGQPSAVAWSKPACIRGAVPAPSGAV